MNHLCVKSFFIFSLVFGAFFSAHANPLLNNTKWQLIEFQSMDDSTKTPANPENYTMHFSDNGKVSFQLNCNRGMGNWSSTPSMEATNGQLRFGPIAMTRMLCPPPSLDEFIAKQTEYIRSYLIKDGKLYLSLMADGGIFAWEPLKNDSEQAAPRNWEVDVVDSALNMRAEPSLQSKVIAKLQKGDLLDNLGCQTLAGKTWCDVQPIAGGGIRGYVSSAYLKPAVGPDGNVPRGEDDSAYRAGQGVFDATGKIPCAINAGQPSMQCNFGVARSPGGYATIVVEKPDGMKRAIFFKLGKPLGADTSEADWGEFSASKTSDLNFISIGSERYEIPDAIILGG